MKFTTTILIALTASIISCSSSDFEKSTVQIRTDGLLNEERTYIGNKFANIKYYNEERKIKLIDSIVFDYNQKGTLNSINTYEYIDGGYQKGIEILDYDKYELTFNCIEEFNTLNSSKFLYEQLKDVCLLTNSILPDDRVMNVQKTTNKGVITYSYSGINAIFLNLSQELQAYFYNQKIQNFEVVINEFFLLKDSYSFDEGTLDRSYQYDQEQIKKIIIKATYQNKLQDTIIITKEFTYK